MTYYDPDLTEVFCDGPAGYGDCRARINVDFARVPETIDASIEKSGWLVRAGRHYCPQCRRGFSGLGNASGVWPA